MLLFSPSTVPYPSLGILDENSLPRRCELEDTITSVPSLVPASCLAGGKEVE